MKPQNKKRFGAAVLLLILLFVLSACSRGRVKSVRRRAARPYQQSRKKPRSRKQSSRRHRTLPQMKPFSISAQGTVALPNTL